MARKEKTIHYLYKTTCLITNRYYIGMHSTSNLNDGYMGSGKRLRYSIRKYGVDNHVKEILGFFESRELLIEAEKKSITLEMITDKDCMNLKEGGTGGFSSEEHMRLAQENGRKKTNYIRWKSEREKNINITISTNKKMWDDKEYRNKMLKIINWTGKKHSNDSKQKMSEKAKERVGETNSQYGTCWITKHGLNKKIKKDNIETYLNEGWVKGRKILR